MTTAIIILLIVQILLMAAIVCLLLRQNTDTFQNGNSHGKITTYNHPKRP